MTSMGDAAPTISKTAFEPAVAGTPAAVLLAIHTLPEGSMAMPGAGRRCLRWADPMGLVDPTAVAGTEERTTPVAAEFRDRPGDWGAAKLVGCPNIAGAIDCDIARRVEVGGA